MRLVPDRALVFSVLLHVALLGASAMHLDWKRRTPPGAPGVTIKATVVNAAQLPLPRELPDLALEAEREAQRLADELAARQQREEQARLERVRVEDEKAADEEAERVRLADEKAQRVQQAEADRQRKIREDEARERVAKAQVERQRKAQEEEKREREAREEAQRQRNAKEEAERQRLASEAAEKKRLVEEAAEKKRRAEAAAEKKRKEDAEREEVAKKIAAREAAAARERKDRAEREQQLKQMLALDTQRQSAVDSGLLAQYKAMVQQKIQRSWNRPPSARDGIQCRVSVEQIPGGEVVSVNILDCNGDQAVRRSIEAAVYKASPLPEPPDPTLFFRNLELDFVPK